MPTNPTIPLVGARAAVHASQFNGKQESKPPGAEPTCAAPATVKQSAPSGAALVNQPLGALKQVPGKATRVALPARIPANEAAAACAMHAGGHDVQALAGKPAKDFDLLSPP